jgi:RNA polymerase sigma-70 factor (ECF subfamily)
MSEEPSFRDLIARVRAGDVQTVTELVRRYEPYLRAVLRVRLTNTRLQRLLDSADICQSILHTFLVRAAAGQFDLDTPVQLRQLLVTMALNKLRNYARKYHHTEQPLAEAAAAVDPGLSPSQVVANTDLLERFRSRLSEEERRVVDLRALGRTWPEIATEVGGQPDALRMQHARAIDRVLRELQIE